MKTLKHPSYTFRKGRVYYFSKAVPKDLADYYAKPRIVKSLRTKSIGHAKTASKVLSARLEDYWLGLRSILISDYSSRSNIYTLIDPLAPNTVWLQMVKAYLSSF